jgi:glycosidase
MYVIFDIVLNHAGDVFEYVLNDGRHVAEADWRDTPYTINWRDEDGQGRPNQTESPQNPPRDAAVWPSELRHNDVFRRKGRGGEAGGDFSSLKEMVTDLRAFDGTNGFHFPVRNALIRAYQYVIAKFDVDGFRIDTLKYIEPDFAQVFTTRCVSLRSASVRRTFSASEKCMTTRSRSRVSSAAMPPRTPIWSAWMLRWTSRFFQAARRGERIDRAR